MDTKKPMIKIIMGFFVCGDYTSSVNVVSIALPACLGVPKPNEIILLLLSKTWYSMIPGFTGCVYNSARPVFIRSTVPIMFLLVMLNNPCFVCSAFRDINNIPYSHELAINNFA